MTSTTVVIQAQNHLACYARVKYGVSEGSLVQWDSENGTSYAADELIERTSPTLSAGTKFYYRLEYKALVGDSWITTGPVQHFTTQRAASSTFKFDIITDTHAPNVSTPDWADSRTISEEQLELYSLTKSNIMADDPDFVIDLGDRNNLCETDVIESEEVDAICLESIRLSQENLHGEAGITAPVYYAIGNADGGKYSGADNFDDHILARKKYYPNPYDDSGALATFYNTPNANESYYAWKWGDALFIVLDPFSYTDTNPIDTTDGWLATLGETQYNWLYTTLSANSSVKWKFIFIHNLVGANWTGGAYGHGGKKWIDYAIEGLPSFEWGGHDDSGVDQYKSGGERDTDGGHWAHGPIINFLESFDVTCVFMGHYHGYAQSVWANTKYLTMAVPKGTSNDAYGLNYGATPADNGNYLHGYIINKNGHIRVTITGTTSCEIEYVASVRPEDEAAEGYSNKDIHHSVIIYGSDTPVDKADANLCAYWKMDEASGNRVDTING